jgi:hypothetical protein
MTRDELLDLIILNIDDNNNNEIDYARMRAVLNNFIDVVLPAATAAVDGAVPYVDSGAYTSSDALQVLSGIVTLKKLNLTNGIPFADYIYNSGTFTGVSARTLITKRFVELHRVAVGVISDNINLGTALRVGDSVTLVGGIAHTVAEGDTFILTGQTNPAENIPYTAVSDKDAPVVAAWYVAAENQNISIQKGPITTQVMPAIGTGDDPVLAPDNGDLAFQLYVINNF